MKKFLKILFFLVLLALLIQYFVILFTSRDYELNSTVANRVIEILPDGKIIDKPLSYENYLENKNK